MNFGREIFEKNKLRNNQFGFIEEKIEEIMRNLEKIEY